MLNLMVFAHVPYLLVFTGKAYNELVLAPLAKVITQRITPIKRIEGNVTGLKAKQIHRLQHIYRRKVPAQHIVTQELARYLWELSLEINCQIGVFIDRNTENAMSYGSGAEARL
jgi:hypothetical protein